MKAIAVAFALVVAAGAPQSDLPTETIVIDTHQGAVKFHVEIASNWRSQEKGLMYRKSLDKDAGMIFVFGDASFQTFWMKNTLIPLDLLFVRADGTISSVAADAVPLSEAQIRSIEPVSEVIEINGGLARELNIRAGDKVHIPAHAVP
jgi:uncharacterized membrane protein (UPF0127 family)